ncbi:MULTISPECIES: DNA-3-methyladenine glycosylase [unclassified Sporolactobacillus]|uniref:DNA-3-methyladenine glycosylase n=1 Tax=unclassified Sporolactobacillus TaxID=2628533 RepID=UPI0023678C87|nr:DNA-3-methyladenine glycosylase [Sporolactobacillus sp. CQH2019]MDD9150596.1 DNA-3-methyladenine glycosylase [Sporolactobacillus sp. CQH2019]
MIDQSETARYSDFFNHRPTEEIARAILGKRLVYRSPQGLLSGYLVEVEAYLGEKDSTAHAYKGRRTAANEALYGPPATIYIFTLRGYMMLNVITQNPGTPQGILIRAAEPEHGRAIMEQNRGKTGFALTSGPGRLTQAFGIRDRSLNLESMGTAPLHIALNGGRQPAEIAASARIGVSRRGNSTFAPYRFFVKGNPYVSDMKKRDMDLATHGWRMG